MLDGMYQIDAIKNATEEMRQKAKLRILTQDPLAQDILEILGLSEPSPFGLPLTIDLPGVNAPDWIEEGEEDDDE